MNFKYLIFLLIIFSIFIFSYSRELTEPDELKYVEISREMLEAKNFLYPIYNYELYLDKGPLYFYILIFSQKIFGESKFSYIFPSQIFSIFILIIFYKILKLFKVKENEIFLSILVLFSSIQFHFLSKAVRMDIILTFFVIFSYYLLFLKIFKDKKNLEFLYGLSFAFSLLTKGPVSFIWFWAVPIFYGIIEKERKVFKFLFHPLNLFFSFFPVLLWTYFLYNKLGLGPFKEIFQRQTLQRIHSSFAHKRPIYYYLYMLPLSFFPYTFFLPFSLFKKEKFKGENFFFLWFLAPFIIFSLISGKISIYLLPSSFPLSLYISKFLLSEKIKIKYILSIISILFIIFGFFIYKNNLRFPEISPYINNIEFLFLWISLTFLLIFFKNKNFIFLFSILSLIFCLLLTIILYPLTYNISLKNFSLKYKCLSKKDKFGYSFCDIKPSFLYYSKKKFIKIHKNEEVEEKLKEGKFIIIKEKNFNHLPEEVKKICNINFKQERLGEDFIIISTPIQKQNEH